MSHFPLCLPALPSPIPTGAEESSAPRGQRRYRVHGDWHPGPNLPTFVFGDSKVGSMGAGSGRNLPTSHGKTKVTTFVSWKQRNCDAGHWAGFLTAEPADPPALEAQRMPHRCHSVRGSTWSYELSADNLSIKAESCFHHLRRGQNGHIKPPIICFSKPAASSLH